MQGASRRSQVVTLKPTGKRVALQLPRISFLANPLRILSFGVISHLSHVTSSLRILPSALLYVARRRSHLRMRSCLFPHRKHPHLKELALSFMRLRSCSFSMMPCPPFSLGIVGTTTLFPTGYLFGSEHRMFVCPTSCSSAFRSPARQNIKPCLQQPECGAMSIGTHQSPLPT
jgi:hypothetical protein